MPFMSEDETDSNLPNGGHPTEGTVADVARHLDLSERQVYALIKRGVLPSYPRGKFNLGTCFLHYVKHLGAEVTVPDPVTGETMTFNRSR